MFSRINTSALTCLHLNILVEGHFLTADHWYNNPSQGSRIYGNIAHWVDLAIHLCFWLPNPVDILDISIKYLDVDSFDQNLILILSSPYFSATISFTCRREPSQGVYESIHVSSNTLSADIHNFESMRVDSNGVISNFSTLFKSAGHKQAVLQPRQSFIRPEYEFLLSELLLSEIHSMARDRQQHRQFELSKAIQSLLSARNASVSH